MIGQKPPNAKKYDTYLASRIETAKNLLFDIVPNFVISQQGRADLHLAFNYLQTHHGPIFIDSLKTVAIHATGDHKHMADKLLDLFSNSSSLGYRLIVNMIIQGCPMVAMDPQLSAEIKVVHGFGAASSAAMILLRTIQSSTPHINPTLVALYGEEFVDNLIG